MATASLADLRRSFPQARIDVLVRPGRDGLLEGLDCFDSLRVDDSRRGVRRVVALASELRRERYDLALLFTNSLRSALLARLARIPERIGYRKGGQSVLLSRRVEPVRTADGKGWKPRPMPEIYADLCAAVGVRRGDGRPRLAVSDAQEARALRARRALGVDPGERLFGLAPGAAFGASKLWPVERFARLADSLAERLGQRAIIFCGPGETAIADELSHRMARPHVNTARQVLGLDLMKPFVRDLSLLVTTDSGPRHIAAAFAVPAAVVMGPTDPRWTNANLETTVVVRHDVPCGPCHLERCPLDHRCMLEITPEEVLASIEGLFQRIAGTGTGTGTRMGLDSEQERETEGEPCHESSS